MHRLPAAVFAPFLRNDTHADTTLVQKRDVSAHSVGAAHQIAQFLGWTGAEFAVNDAES
jgi:hypothetical protein